MAQQQTQTKSAYTTPDSSVYVPEGLSIWSAQPGGISKKMFSFFNFKIIL